MPEQAEWPVKLFEMQHGVRPVQKITKSDIRDFRDLIETLPSARPAGNRGNSLAALRKRAAKGERPIARATAQKHLGAIGTLLRFAVAEGYIEASPADGIHYHAQRTKFAQTQRQKRRSLSPAEVAAVLAAVSKLPASKADAIWFTRLLIYTGARGEELAQLAPGDIRDHAGVAYLSIHDEGARTIKNRSSLRVVPIYPVLIDAGFLEFCERRGNAPFLFTSLKADSRGRRYSRMQRRVTTILRSGAGISDSRVVPHSFRHTFKDALRMSGAPDEVADRLLGHTSPDRSVPAGYGNANQVAVLAPWLAKVDPLDDRRLVSIFSESEGEG